jgi:hypothetical protein
VESKKPSVKSRLAQYLASRTPAPISEREWQELRDLLAPASAGYLRRLLRASEVPLAPLVEGIRQDSFQHLERTLISMEEEYRKARVRKDVARQRNCRRAVIEAKDHARWAMQRSTTPSEKKAEKKEMIEWMLVWLGNPEIFPRWVRLRKQAARERE